MKKLAIYDVSVWMNKYAKPRRDHTILLPNCATRGSTTAREELRKFWPLGEKNKEKCVFWTMIVEILLKKET